jgi:beta-lactamase regulating signal transducer with metallopeptidase domain
MAVDAVALGFLATYAIHSTLLLALARLVSRAIPPGSLALRGLVWRVALFGGVATAGLQVATGHRTPFAHWTLAGDPEPVSCGDRDGDVATPETRVAPSAASVSPFAVLAPLAVERAIESATSPAEEPPLDGDGGEGARGEPGPSSERAGPAALAAPGAAETAGDAVPEAAVAGADARHAPAWREHGGIAFALVLALVGSAFAAMALRLGSRLRGALAVERGPMREEIDALSRAAFGRPRRVRLLAAPRLDAPLSFGLARPTICVPPRALDDLSHEEQRALVAHELAHLARRDPLWLSAAWLVEKVFFFQPLNRVARREMHDVAELACDAWAARRTGLQLALASCLARIATWMVETRSTLPATSMAGAGGRSRLARRVERLLDDAPASIEERARPAARVAAVAAIAGVALAAPGVSAWPAARDALARAPEVGHAPSLAFDDAASAPEPATTERATIPVAIDLNAALEELRGAIGGLQREAEDLLRQTRGLAAGDETAPELEAIERRIARVERRCARLAQLATAIQDSPRAAALAERLHRTGP